jgi:GT2 family glycosyltransferase
MATQSPAQVTVSIVNWNTREELGRCLDSVLAQQGVQLDIIVVDNASSDDSDKFIAEHYPNIAFIANDKNIGFSRAHNQALMCSDAPYFMILNPDAVLPEPDVLEKLVAFAEENASVAIVGPRIENPDGSLQFSARRFPTVGAALFRRTPLGRLFPRNRFVREYIMADWPHNETRTVDWVSGSAMLVRKAAVDVFGPLDGGFFMYCEDVDWCYRAWQAGWKVCYCPVATVVHKIGSASDQRPVPMIYQFHRSMLRFYLKHYARGLAALSIPFVFLGLAARAAFMIALTRIPISREAQDGGERLVK